MLFRDTYVHMQLFHQVVSEQQLHNVDDLAPTSEDLGDERNDKNKKPRPKKGTSPKLRSTASLSDVHDPNASPLSVILTDVIRAMPYARFGGADASVTSHSFVGSIEL